MWSEGLNKITLKTEAASGKSPHTTNDVQRINSVFMKEKPGSKESHKLCRRSNKTLD